MSQLQAGDRINNYLLDERIGTGSFGEVWKAHHHIFHTWVAIKIPTDPQYVRHLQREGVAVHGLQHPNIVRALDLDPYGDPPYLIMEYVDGPSLRHVLDRNREGLPMAITLIVLDGIVSALEAAHEANLIHRDIKPANVLLAGGEDLSALTPGRVKVTDFGLGRAGGAMRESMRQSGSLNAQDGGRIAGTLVYMSPEQRDGQAVDARSDLYSVGVVLHEMLTGVLPQGTDSPRSLRPEVPRWLEGVFERCYTRRDHRYTSASEIRRVIEQHAEPRGTSVSGRRVGPPPLRQVNDRRLCPRCQGVVERDDQFCMHCGAQLVDEIARCPSCHAFVGRTDNFCILCGKDLRLTI